MDRALDLPYSPTHTPKFCADFQLPTILSPTSTHQPSLDTATTSTLPSQTLRFLNLLARLEIPLPSGLIPRFTDHSLAAWKLGYVAATFVDVEPMAASL